MTITPWIKMSSVTKKVTVTSVLVATIAIGALGLFNLYVADNIQPVPTEASLGGTTNNPEVTCTHYASPTGVSGNAGTEQSPWDLVSAIAKPSNVIAPGSVLCLKGGSYFVPRPAGTFISTLAGSAQSPIKIISAPGEWAVIDGNLSGQAIKNMEIFEIRGGYTWVMDLEITNSDPDGRMIDDSSSNPPNRRGGAIFDSSAGNKFINLVIHDAGQGISAFSGSQDGEYYGNIIYHNGWDAPDRNHGHGIYTQNRYGGKLYENNVVLSNFDYTIHMYGSGSAFLNNINWKKNVFVNGATLFGGSGPTLNLTLDSNYSNVPLRAGYNDLGSDGINIINNYAINAFVYGSQNVTITDNTFIAKNSESVLELFMNNDISPNSSTYDVEDNTYYRPSAFTLYANIPGNVCHTWRLNVATTGTGCTQYWQDLGFDLNSTYTLGLPTVGKTFLTPNTYDSNRATITIFNWPQSNTVDVDVDDILNPGDTYELRNVQNYFGDVITGTYNGGDLSIPMTGRTVAKPIGYDEVGGNWYHDPFIGMESTFPSFGAFILKKTAGAPTPAPTINSFSAAPTSITSGQSSTLSWLVTGATSLTINQGVGTVTGVGTSVSPTTTTTYTLTATNSSGSDTETITVTVSPAPTGGGGGGGGGGSGGGGSGGGGGTTTPSPTNTPVTTTGMRLVNNNGTYYLIQNNVRKGVTSPGILNSCGFEFKDAKTATAAEMTLSQSNLLPCDGSLVKSSVDQTVYLISNNKRYAFTSGTVFTQLGFKFSSVLLVTDPELQLLPKDTNISDGSSAHKSGTDINVNGTVYWISPSGTKHPYPSLTVWNSWHKDGDFSTVVPANANDLNLTTGGNVPLRTF